MQAIWPQSVGWTHNGGISGEDGDEDLDDGTDPATQPSQAGDSYAAKNPLIGAGANDDDTYSGYKRELAMDWQSLTPEMHSVSLAA